MKSLDPDLPVPAELRAARLDRAAARSLLADLGHPRPRRWIETRLRDGRLREEGVPPTIPAPRLWRELLADECAKLYNQAWCALTQIEEAPDDDSVLLLAIDSLPSAVEQAFSLAPALAGEHLELLHRHRKERYEDFVRELGVGTSRERRERIECLAFWEENGQDLSELRRRLFQRVRATLLTG